jgi:glycosyltransferase involved in cell wall biosynthesis
LHLCKTSYSEIKSLRNIPPSLKNLKNVQNQQAVAGVLFYNFCHRDVQMKICMLIWSYWPGPQGGAERQCRLICPYIIRKGAGCNIVTARLAYKSKRIEADGDTQIYRLGVLIPLIFGIKESFKNIIFNVSKKYFRSASQNDTTEADSSRQKLSFWIELPFVWLARLTFFCELIYWCYKNHLRVDVIHVHEAGWLGALGVIIGKLYKIPVVCKAATHPPFPQIGWDVPFRLILRKFQRLSEKIIILNDQARESLTLDGFPADKIITIPNAVLLPVKTEFPRNSDIVLYVGNFSQGNHWKAFDVLFDAWKIIHEQQTGLRLVVLGGGDRSTWEKYVDRLGCTSSVQFMGRVSNPEEYYGMAGIFILPSRVEGMSNALLEAQSWGIPCVVSDIPGNTSIVENEVNGLVVPVNDSQSLANAVIKINNDPLLRRKIGAAARNLMEEKYEINGIAEKLIMLYEDVKSAKAINRTRI